MDCQRSLITVKKSRIEIVNIVNIKDYDNIYCQMKNSICHRMHSTFAFSEKAASLFILFIKLYKDMLPCLKKNNFKVKYHDIEHPYIQQKVI